MKKIIMKVLIAALCLVMIPAYAGCSNGSSGISTELQQQLDEMQARIDQLVNADSQTQNELNALKARVAILEGKVLYPKEYYEMGETITYVSNGLKLFDFVLLDAYKTDNLLTYITYRFTSYSNLLQNAGLLSDYIKFALRGPNGGYTVSNKQHQFSDETKFFTISAIGEGTAEFLLVFPCGTSYNTIAKVRFDLQMRTE